MRFKAIWGSVPWPPQSQSHPPLEREVADAVVSDAGTAGHGASPADQGPTRY